VRVDSGEDIAPARGQQIAELIETWLETVRLTRRPGTAAGYRRLITAHIIPIFGKDVPAAITRNRIEAWHGRIAARTSTHANRALGTLSAFMSWLERDGKITGNPCRGVRRRPENQRHVFLGAAEIAAAHRALDGDNQSRPAALALRLALMTGCRIGEAIGITADQIDAARCVWTKPASHTKQRKLHVVPLTAEALSVAQELLRLPRPKYEDCRQAWLRARKTIGREDTRVHDLRHSYASSLARNGASLVQIGKLLGHTAPITTARYLALDRPGFARSGGALAMSKRRAGRPKDTTQARLQQALVARHIVEQELAAPGRPPKEIAIERAASRLKISAKTVRRRLALLDKPDETSELVELLLSRLEVIDGGEY
jgi:integrase